MANEAGGVEVVIENFGESALAERFGVERYPAIFVQDVLIARPKDFGFYGTSGSQGQGRYTPWLEEASHALFRQDLQRAVEAATRGDYEGLKRGEVTVSEEAGLTELPDFSAKLLDGTELSSAELNGRIVLVEFWATWCPPCLKALPWLSEVHRRYPDDVAIVSIAIESPDADLRRLVAERELPFPVIAGGSELARTFGDVLSVPTLFVFDRDGQLQRTAFGSPPGLAEQIDQYLAESIDGTSRGQR